MLIQQPINLENFETIGDKIYVYKNFISPDEIESIKNEILKIEDWKVFPYFEKTNTIAHTNCVAFIQKRIQSLLDNKHFAADANSIVKMVPGQFWDPHVDVHDFEEIEKLASEYVDGDEFSEERLSVFGTIVYYQLPEVGGGLFYPKQNIEYKPSVGDLVIHGSGVECEHGVSKVIEGERYATPSHIYKYVKIKKEIDGIKL